MGETVLHYNYSDIHSGACDRYHVRYEGNGDCIAHTATEYAAKTIIEHARLAALVPQLMEALRDVENWWLSDGMKASYGAPACIFTVRQVLVTYNEPDSQEG